MQLSTISCGPRADGSTRYADGLTFIAGFGQYFVGNLGPLGALLAFGLLVVLFGALAIPRHNNLLS